MIAVRFPTVLASHGARLVEVAQQGRMWTMPAGADYHRAEPIWVRPRYECIVRPKTCGHKACT